MPIHEVTDVVLLPERTERLLGFELDGPRRGTRKDLFVLHLSGWALGRDSQARTIEILQGDELVRVTPIRGPRQDVADAMGVPDDTECVFHALVGLIGLPLEVRLGLRVVLEDGTKVPVGFVTVRRKPLRPDYEPRLQPLMITTLGRSGSTWLMQILAAHPEIVVFRRFPYESAPARYWLHMLRVLSQPANLPQSAYPDDFHKELWWVGSNPYHDERAYEQLPVESWFAQAYVEHLAAFCQRTIDDWYTTLARTQLQPAPLYFAEKHTRLSYLPGLVWELYPHAKELFLVRDFRDMASSIMAFDRRRGFAGFDRADGTSEADYVKGELRQMALGLRQSWRERGARAHLVRYEDLVLQQRETVVSMLDYLEVDSSPGTIDEMLAQASEDVLTLPGSSHEAADVRMHRTIADPTATIGRWRREGDDAFDQLAQEAFGDVLSDFGYAV